MTIEPILWGAAKPIHILELPPSVRRIASMTAMASFDAKAASKSAH